MLAASSVPDHNESSPREIDGRSRMPSMMSSPVMPHVYAPSAVDGSTSTRPSPGWSSRWSVASRQYVGTSSAPSFGE